MSFKWIFLIAILVIGVWSTISQFKKKSVIGVVFWSIISAIALGIIGNFCYDVFKPMLPYPETTDSMFVNDGTNEQEEYTEIDEYTMDTILLTRNELDPLNKDESWDLLNEIYARNGYIFGDESIQKYFVDKDWYVAVTNDMDYVYNCMTDTEKENVQIIVEFQHERKYR